MLENARNLSENFRRPFCSFFWDRLKKLFEGLFLEIALKIYIYIFFWKHLRLCPWPRPFPVA